MESERVRGHEDWSKGGKRTKEREDGG